MTWTGLLKKVSYTFKVQADRVEAVPYRVHKECQEVEKAQCFSKSTMVMLVLTKGLDIMPNKLRPQNISV